MLAKRCCGHMMGVEGWMNHLTLLYVGPYILSFHINIGGPSLPSFNIYQALEPHIIFSLEPILYLVNHWNPILYFINHWNPILWLKKYHIHPPSPSQISASCSSWLQQHWARQEPNSFVSLFHHYITFGHGKKNILCVLSTLIKLYPHRDGQENLVPLLSCSSMMYRLHTCLSHLIGLKFLVVPISSCPQTAQTCLHRASCASEPWLDLEGREESSHEMQQQPTLIRSKNLIGSKIKK